MAHLPRGIAPELLISQVHNTMPYVFVASVEGERSGTLGAGPTPFAERDSLASAPPEADRLSAFPPAVIVRALGRGQLPKLSHFEYFRLCLSAHYLTCGTPVPTDVDNQIRQKLWPAGLSLDVATEMTELVLESRGWDFTAVTTRFVYGPAETPWAREALSGHLGEWFTVAAAAYSALGRYPSPRAETLRKRVFDAIAGEVARHAEIFGALWRARDGGRCLWAASSIAHNFGDLDRVMDMWELPATDPLRLKFYKLSAQGFGPGRELRYSGRLWVAGELYKSTIEGSSLALENHRHYALRKPRALRRRPEFLVPTGPFFDGWGERVARGLAAADGKPSDDTWDVLENLRYGWQRQPRSVGYGRGLVGFFQVHPELRETAWTGDLERQRLLTQPRAEFEKSWADAALARMDQLPTQAT